ncbi:hypothetical protein ACFFJT_10670 [Dyella flava]|uniref:Uncharacterized protein n=1 Tax=Dyella flava TaxID=1920170 RepID=A0ABS2JY44_9GAMM|nr:hypothetical protein [Dyella flava]MBM7123902.1 hypothetical protein [Dyella flava]
MSTLNGFGTMFYGWKHLANQPSTATKWLTAFYIPIIPLGRYELIVHTNFARESTQIRSTLVGVVASQQNRFEILGKTSLHWPEILMTYTKTFIVLPLLMFAPLLIMFLLSRLGWWPRYKTSQDMPIWLNVVLVIFAAGQLIGALYWPIWAIRKSRGMHIDNKPNSKSKKASVDRRSVEHHM